MNRKKIVTIVLLALFIFAAMVTVYAGGYRTCTICGGAGGGQCYNCDGDGRIDGYIKCTVCNGSGNYRDGRQCATCGGSGERTIRNRDKCGVCNGSGQIICRTCNGRGEIYDPNYTPLGQEFNW